jgi:hypothetical protein
VIFESEIEYRLQYYKKTEKFWETRLSGAKLSTYLNSFLRLILKRISGSFDFST